MRKYTRSPAASSIAPIPMGLVVALNFASAFLALPSASAQECDPVETHKLLSSDGASEDKFGHSIAISGTTAIVGAYMDDDNGSWSGSAYLFDTTSGQQLLKLLPSDGAAYDRFGYSVAISGTTAIVGARGDDVNGEDSGSAYLFDTTTGRQIAKLLPSDGAEFDLFGWSVAISGTTAIVGAKRDDDNGDNSGSAYLFDATTGQHIAKLLPNDAAAGDVFGISVGISGTTAIVGAYADDDNGEDSGSAYLFDTTTGRQIVKLLPSDGSETDHFGMSVAITGATAVVGAFRDDGNATDSGSAYLFDTTTGQQIAKLLAGDGGREDLFGESVAISDAIAIVGAHWDDDNGRDSGSAYLFDTATGQQIAKILPSDGAEWDEFGQSVAISGITAIAGAPFDDDNGSAYVFDLIRCSSSRLVVAPEPLVAGEVGTFTVTTALPNERTWLLYSLKGPGVTFISALNVVVNLDNPQLGAGPRMSDANGDVEWVSTIPAVQQPIDVWFQVVQMQNVSNLVATRIVP